MSFEIAKRFAKRFADPNLWKLLEEEFEHLPVDLIRLVNEMAEPEFKYRFSGRDIVECGYFLFKETIGIHCVPDGSAGFTYGIFTPLGEVKFEVAKYLAPQSWRLIAYAKDWKEESKVTAIALVLTNEFTLNVSGMTTFQFHDDQFWVDNRIWFNLHEESTPILNVKLDHTKDICEGIEDWMFDFEWLHEVFTENVNRRS